MNKRQLLITIGNEAVEVVTAAHERVPIAGLIATAMQQHQVDIQALGAQMAREAVHAAITEALKRALDTAGKAASQLALPGFPPLPTGISTFDADGGPAVVLLAYAEVADLAAHTTILEANITAATAKLDEWMKFRRTVEPVMQRHGWRVEEAVRHIRGR